jgi:hypothetical protein
MNFFNEYALLVAVATPVVVIFGLQVLLFVAGERGTGILPGFSKYPSIEMPEPKAVNTVAETPTIVIHVAANDETERLAA